MLKEAQCVISEDKDFSLFSEDVVCGICGIYFIDQDRKVDESVLAQMARTMSHRGPDDEGFYLDGNLGLAHQRLSIIDTSPLGRQPMENEDETLWIVCNGEVYNYLELRQQLLARGHTFRSHSDTEVILHLYEDEGSECVKRLNGMFAFAIWNSRDRTIFAARDHFGIKPFYYAKNKDCFLFASEIKALLQTKLIQAQINRAGLADYLTFQFCLDEKTLFKGIHKLPPGHTLLIKHDGTTHLNKYWDIEFTIDTDHTENYFEHQLLRLLEDAVRIQLRADVPVGAHLSGGLDSSTVTCMASSLLGSPIKTFSGGFKEGPQYDETPYARIVSQSIGSEHYEIYPTAEDFVKVIGRLIYHMDEPAAGPGLFPQYFVSKLAGEHVKVVLGGQGGDETFGGYSRYLIAYLEQCLKGGIEGTQENPKYIVTFESILPNLRQLEGYEPLLSYYWEKGLFEPEDRRYFRLVDRSNSLMRLIDQDFLPDRQEYDLYENYRNVFYSADCRSLINKMTWFDMKTLLPALLHVEDRTSMAASLESRVPLLDRRIVELVASMPPMVKYKGGRSKHVFRQVVRNIVPSKVYERTDKMGFPVPLHMWLQREPVHDFVKEVLLGGKATSRGWIRTDQLENLLKTERDYGRGIWGLLCLELWMQTFLDDPFEPI
jgi:asparagine synthase (glutamine-hydrolysing)